MTDDIRHHRPAPGKMSIAELEAIMDKTEGPTLEIKPNGEVVANEPDAEEVERRLKQLRDAIPTAGRDLGSHY